MGIIYTCVTVFGLTTIIGMYLLTLFLRKKAIPKGATLIHMLYAVMSLLLLVFYCFIHKTGPWISVIIFVMAATMGFILNFRDLTGRKLPKWLGILHGLMAITGFVFLILFTLPL